MQGLCNGSSSSPRGTPVPCSARGHFPASMRASCGRPGWTRSLKYLSLRWLCAGVCIPPGEPRDGVPGLVCWARAGKVADGVAAGWAIPVKRSTPREMNDAEASGQERVAAGGSQSQAGCHAMPRDPLGDLSAEGRGGCGGSGEEAGEMGEGWRTAGARQAWSGDRHGLGSGDLCRVRPVLMPSDARAGLPKPPRSDSSSPAHTTSLPSPASRRGPDPAPVPDRSAPDAAAVAAGGAGGPAARISRSKLRATCCRRL